ncbi:MAG: nitroreductase [Chloroflexota bacterium]
MEVLEAIKTRKSIRGYKPDPVPRKTIEAILETARHSPSSLNTQPWQIHVVTGRPLEEIRKTTLEKFAAGEAPRPELPLFQYEGEYRQRQVGLAVQLFQLMGITREDKAARTAWGQRGLRFFDAPVALIITAERSILAPRAHLDCGFLAHAICLAACHYGLGTCIEDQGVYYPEVVRAQTGIPENQRIVISIALGYPDGDFPANAVESAREPLGNTCHFHGFA